MSVPKTLAFMSLLALAAGAFAQAPPPSPPQSPGERLRAEGDIPGAIEEYRKALLQDPKDAGAVLGLARALSINKKMDECFKYLSQAAELAPSLGILTDGDLVTARGDRRWGAFEDGLLAALSAKSSTAYRDVAYAKALWKMRAWDQAFFQEVGIAGRKIGMRSSVVEALWSLKFMIQQRSQAELEELISKKGWPRVAAVGREAAMAAFLVVMHSSDGAQKKYLADIKKVCEAGELPWERYAAVYDRGLYNENQPQRYGTHTRYNEQTKKEELYPLEDETRVDEWRKELGLPALEDYLKPMGIVFRPKKR
jgi:hypothetical protein